MEEIKRFLNESADLKRVIADTLAEDIEKAIIMIRSSLDSGGKLLLMGNGGSAGDAQHIAAELIGRYKKERPALPAIALTVDTSALTAIGNDYGYDYVFERQVEGLAQSGDIVLGISTSGNSENVVRALKKAKEKGARTIALLGKGGGRAKEEAEIAIIVPSIDTARIQEAHITIGHIICEILESNV
jgi:D-sedoheptulose 7-phosphate isomerase